MKLNSVRKGGRGESPESLRRAGSYSGASSVVDLAQATAILLRCRQNAWAEYEAAVGDEKQLRWWAWNAVRRAMHHVWSPTAAKDVIPKKRPAGKQPVITGRREKRA